MERMVIAEYLKFDFLELIVRSSSLQYDYISIFSDMINIYFPKTFYIESGIFLSFALPSDINQLPPSKVNWKWIGSELLYIYICVGATTNTFDLFVADS